VREVHSKLAGAGSSLYQNHYSNLQEYVARVSQRWLALKGPGNDTSRGVTIRPIMCTKGLTTTEVPGSIAY